MEIHNMGDARTFVRRGLERVHSLTRRRSGLAQDVQVPEEVRLEREGDAAFKHARELLKHGNVVGAKEALELCHEKYAASGSYKKPQLISAAERKTEQEGDAAFNHARELLKAGNVREAKEALEVCHEKYAAAGSSKRPQLINPRRSSSLDQDRMSVDREG